MAKKRALILIFAAFFAVVIAVICQFGRGKGERTADYHPTYFSYATLGELALHSDAIFIGTAGEVRANQSINVGTRYPLYLDYTVASVHVTKALKGDIAADADVEIKEPEFYGMKEKKIEPGKTYLFFAQTYTDPLEPLCLANPDQGKLEMQSDIVNSTDLSSHYGLDQMSISELGGQIAAAEQAATQNLISLQDDSDEFSLTERELKIIAVKEKWLEELNLLEERAKADGTFESREYWREYQQKIDEMMERLDQIPE